MSMGPENGFTLKLFHLIFFHSLNSSQVLSIRIIVSPFFTTGLEILYLLRLLQIQIVYLLCLPQV